MHEYLRMSFEVSYE